MKNGVERDPQRKKARDAVRQRKIASNSSDKAARRHAPAIKAAANRKARRLDRQQISDADDLEMLSDQDIAAYHRVKPRHWGSTNAAKRRAWRTAERAFLDKTPASLISGRRRAQFGDLTPDCLRERAVNLGTLGFSDLSSRLRKIADSLETDGIEERHPQNRGSRENE